MNPSAAQAVTPNVSPEEVYNVICGAASQDPAQVKKSSDRLKELVDLPGTFHALFEIAAQKSVPLQVRQQSIIQFKNTALNHWRSRKLLTEEQRITIKARSFMLLDESDDIIAECNEFVIAKIARQDYPHKWPTLISDLMGIINSNLSSRYGGAQRDLVSLPLRRALAVLNAVVKEFGSMKMLTGVKTMAQIVGQTHLVLQSHYSTIASSLSSLDPSSASSTRYAEDLLLAHLVFKCVVKTAVWAWQRVKSLAETADFDPWLRDIFQNSALQLRALSEQRIVLVTAVRSGPAVRDPVAEQSIKTLYRHINLFGKLFRRFQQLDVARFVAQPVCSDLILYYWSKVVQATNGPSEFIEDSPTAVFPVRFLVQALVLFKESLAQWAPVRKNGTSNEQVLAREFVEDAVKLLVTRFIPLDPTDLETWMADPEEWVNLEEKDNEQWEYELRPCGERVLMTLANQYRQYVVPLLQMTFNQIAPQPATDLPSILQKEALYCAIGRCATRMKDVIPFEQWLANSLIAEAQSTNPNYPLIKRRIAWLIGKWISSACASPNNPKIWEVLVYLLQDRGPGTDAVVRLTAAVALRECVDTIDFDVNVFAPFLPSAVTELVRLSSEADTLESKRRIATSLNTIIERAESRIVPLMSMVAEPVPQLWTAAGEDYLFKSELLVTVTKLIESAKEHSASLCGLVVPLVRESFAPGAQIHLDVDALTLWTAALNDTTTLESINGAPGLIELFPLAMSLLSENLDLLAKIVSIVESYFFLDASRVLQACATDLFRSFLQAMGQAMPLHVKPMAIALNTLFQLAPPALWGEPLHVSGLFAFVIKALLDEEGSTTLQTEYIYLLARIAIVDKQLFMQLISATATSMNVPEKIIYEGILDQWWTRFDSMSEPRFRKLTAMGIASLVSTGRPEVLGRLSTEICNLWLDVFCEIREALDNVSPGGTNLTLYWDRPLDSLFQSTSGTLEYDRRKAAFDNDPVRTTQLTTYIAARLQEAEVVSGGTAVFQAQYLAKADPTVIKQIQAELAGRGGQSSGELLS